MASSEPSKPTATVHLGFWPLLSLFLSLRWFPVQSRKKWRPPRQMGHLMLMFEECPLPQIPKDTPPLGWRHSGVVCAVLEFQSGNAILAQVQGTCLGLSRVSIQQIEHISSVVCTQQIPKSRYHCYTKFPFRGY